MTPHDFAAEEKGEINYTNRDMWKAMGEVFECSQNLFTRLGGFEILWAGAVAFFDTLNEPDIEWIISIFEKYK